MPLSSPTVAAWELGLRLREAREEVGLSGIAAAKSLGISQNFLSDVEHGKRKLTETKLTETCSLYAVRDDEAQELRVLREQADQRAWWTKYTGLFPAELLRYFGYEHGAESIRTHESLLIPGLLQTEAYARAIIAGDSPNVRASDTNQRIQARQLRQRRLSDDEPLKLTALISEGALKQQVGGREVLADQLRHLISLIEEHPDTLEVLVVPFTADAHGALGAPTFHLLSFPSPRLPGLGFQETITHASLVENPVRVNQYNATYEKAMEQTADRKGSLDLIRRELRALT